MLVCKNETRCVPIHFEISLRKATFTGVCAVPTPRPASPARSRYIVPHCPRMPVWVCALCYCHSSCWRRGTLSLCAQASGLICRGSWAIGPFLSRCPSLPSCLPVWPHVPASSFRLLPLFPGRRWGAERSGAGLCGVGIKLFQEDLSCNEPRGFDFSVPSWGVSQSPDSIFSRTERTSQ